MTDPPQLPSAFGIEAVEWEPRGDESLTVRVSGRWRRRRPLTTGQTSLVIEAGGQRQRFPAMPEPPGLTAAAPGTWHLSFTVPIELAPGRGDQVWLQIGGVAVPLPVPLRETPPVKGEGEAEQETTPAPEAGPASAEQMRVVEEEISAIAEIDETDARARILRAEHRLAAPRPAPPAVPAPTPRRPESAPALALERQMVSAQSSSTRIPPAPAPDPGLPAVLSALADELAELRTLAEGERRLRTEAEARAAALERQLQEVTERSERAFEEIGHVREQLASMVGAEQERAVAPSRPGQASAPPSVSSASPVSAPPPAPAPAPNRELDPRRLDEALSRLREQHPPEDHDPGSPESPQALETQPLTAAQQSAPSAPEPPSAPSAPEPPPAPETPPGPEPTAGRAQPPRPPARDTKGSPPGGWLYPAFRALTRSDPVTAGRLVLALLPAHGLVHRKRLDYDLALTGIGCLQVSVPGGGRPAQVTLSDSGRSPYEIDFTVEGDPISLARLLARGRRHVLRLPFRRRRRARISGDRDRAGALFEFVRTPLRLGQLAAAGAVLDPWLMLSLVAWMIDPDWTRGEHFTIAFAEPGGDSAPMLLHIGDGAPLSVLDSVPVGGATTQLILSAGALAGALEGRPGTVEAIRGETRPLAVLQGWIERAQSG